MVIGRVLSNVATELGNLNFILEFALKAREKNLSLARLQPIDYAWDRSHVISYRKMNKLLINKVSIVEPFLAVINEHLLVIGAKPHLASIRQLLVESQFDCFETTIVMFLKLDDMLI